jgi:hypothetical protein
MNIAFILRDGTHYVFKNYKGFSELLEALEPNPDEPLEILEHFTLEEFETAQIEYNKYVVFKDALEDIITTRKLWSKEELKELSKYDLNNPVLEWLMIRDTREDKEIKEILSLYSFNINEIKSDNKILYYLVYETNQDKFNYACFYGHLEVAQWLYSFGDVNIHGRYEYAFRWACREGHLEVTQWLYSLGGVDIHVYEDICFSCACSYGHLEVAQWLWSLGGFHKENIDTGYVHIKDWLATLE